MAILEGKVKDPRVFLPSFHRIELTDDLKHAKIYFTALCNNNERKKLTQGLVSSAGFLSSLVGKNLHLHTNPRFSFVWDNQYIKSLEVIQLIDDLKPKTLFDELHPSETSESEDDDTAEGENIQDHPKKYETLNESNENQKNQT